MKKTINITHVITDSNIGGAGVLLCNLLCAIDRELFNFEVILPKGSELIPSLSALNVCVSEADISSDRSFFYKDFFVLRRLLSEKPPDILHTHGSFSARLAGRSLSLPLCILTRHCDMPIKAPAFIYNMTSDFTVCTSMPLYEHMLAYGIPRERLRFIANGAKECKPISENRKKELRSLFCIPENTRVIGTVGRLEKIKGQDIFLRAAQDVLKVRRDCIFMLVGDGSRRSALEELSAELGISESVRFCGHRQDAKEIMNLFDVAVNSSSGSETSSLAISEALSLKIPVIASDIEGNYRLLNGGRCGFLFKSGDSISLSQKILCVLLKGESVKQISERGFNLYRNELNASAMAKKYKALYKELYREILRKQDGRT